MHEPFAVFCDMTTDGGGKSPCYLRIGSVGCALGEGKGRRVGLIEFENGCFFSFVPEV